MIQESLIGAGQAAAIDQISQERFGIPAEILMENAGRGCFEEVNRKYGSVLNQNVSIAVVAGSGNNGGDALVFARHAHNSGLGDLTVIHKPPKPNTLMSMHLNICTRLGIPAVPWEEAREEAVKCLLDADVIVDGLAGTGLRGAHRDRELIDFINNSAAMVVAIDVPSGIGENYAAEYPAVKADTTLTAGNPKWFMYLPATREFCGDIKRVDPGFPPEAVREQESRYRLWPQPVEIPAIALSSHKGARGRVACIAGSPGTSGAAALCGTAALRSRAGLVRVYTDDQTASVCTTREPALMTQVVENLDDRTIRDVCNWADAVCIGPGLTAVDPDRIGHVVGRLRETGMPVVADASALRALRPNTVPEGTVLTPHPGELAQLVGVTVTEVAIGAFELLQGFVEQTGAIVLLKGSVSILARIREGAVWFDVFDGRQPALGTGGTGDVLAGSIAGLLASGLPPEKAVHAAVQANHQCAHRLRRTRGYFTSSELALELGREIMAMERPNRSALDHTDTDQATQPPAGPITSESPPNSAGTET